MTARNPPGFPLSGQVIEDEDGEWFVQYRPRFRGRSRRPRVQVPAAVADVLSEAAARETDRRQELAGDDKPRKRKKRAKKATKAKATKTSKPRTRRAPSTPRKRTAAKRVAHASEVLADTARDLAKPGQQELFSNPRGAPSLARLGTCADLGRVLEIVVELPNGEHERTRWKRNHPRMLWSPQQKALVWVHNAKLQNRRKGATRSDGAARTFERWSKKAATTTNTLKIPAVKLKLKGRAVHIIYKSDKWNARGKMVSYIHDFGQSVRLYHSGKVWSARGGKLTVTERGIVF